MFIQLFKDYADGRGHNPLKRKTAVIITVVWDIVQFVFLMFVYYVAVEMGDQDKSTRLLNNNSKQFYDDALPTQDNASQSSTEHFESEL